MSYASGLMLGAAVGRQIHNYFSSKNKTEQSATTKCGRLRLPVFAKVFQIEGRRRYRSILMLDNEKLARLIFEKLRHIKCVTKVNTDARTGSILICYAPCNEHRIEHVERYLRRLLFGSSALPGNVSRDMLSSGTVKVYEMFNYVNNYIREKTNNLLDFNILLSMLFIIRGIRKIVLYEQRVSGPQLLWWAFSLLRGWRMI